MMKKSAVALAALLAICSSQAGELSAGKDTKFEVNVELGAYQLSKKNADGTSAKEFLGKGLNQIEIKATHAINGDISVFGEIEVDYDPIVDNNAVQTDDIKFGIKHKQFGTLTVGQFDSFFEDNVIEVLGVGHGENGFVTEASSSNDGRHVQYLKKIGDLTFAADLTFSNNTAKTDPHNGTAFVVSYALGDLTLAAGTSSVSRYKSDTSAVNTAKTVNGLSAIYNWGQVKLSALMAQEKSTGNVKTKYTGAAVVYTMGDFDFGVAMQQVAKEGSAKRNEWSAGVGYNVFKGLQVYMDLNALKNTNRKDDVVELGMKYTF